MRRETSRQIRESRFYGASSRRLYHLQLRAQKAAHDATAVLRAPTPERHDPYRIFTIEPRRLTHVLGRRLPSRLAGYSLDGDWDSELVPLSATALHRGLRQRFVDQLEWSDTELHPSRYRRRCDNEPPQYETYSESEFLRRGQDLDRLYERLATQGYLDYRSRREPVGTEMTVVVGRNGVYARHAGGMHRVIIAQLIGLPSVPIRVFALHSSCRGGPYDPFRAERLEIRSDDAREGR